MKLFLTSLTSLMSLLFLSISFSTSNAFAEEKEHRHHGAHAHGAATLNIAFDNLQGKVEFKGAAEGILGFEHTAKSDTDKKKLSEAISKFEKDISKMVVLAPTLGCSFTKEKIDMVKEESKHEQEHKEKEHKGELHGEHSDFVAIFNVVCKKPLAGTSLTIDFTDFKDLKDLDITVLANDLQKTAEAKFKPVTIEL